ncbi:hypothetical protein N836_24145 [Leptolyngbya sp. Heron Island J]|uniref:hypothetical protein n=1 Tax=Leptolyngbya sp. Heron Island J TaxID=1385935 RepID=UPI0003B96434|nr:hypothetical protein [Leptolyngbya sp. Heron Island J]ESA32882.1 hypothetical protein N836_24145 [Leptolyngbya sp. Heron Island J]
MINQDSEKILLQRRLLGWGLACKEINPSLDVGRDLKLETSATGLDFARVTGLDILNQDLAIALTTLLGSDIFNIQFGFDGLNAIAEETNPVLVRERVRIAIIQLLQKDPRVRRIVDIKLDDGQLVAPVPGSRELNVRVEFETVSGEQTAIDLGEVTLNV